MSHMSPFRMNVPNMGDLPSSVANPKKRRKNVQTPIQTPPNVQDLLPPPLSGYGDTIVASNPFDDCPSSIGSSMTMVRNSPMGMGGPMPGPPSGPNMPGMPPGVNNMNMCRPMGPGMGMGSPMMHSPNAHQNPMMNNPMMMNGPRMNHMGGPGPGGPGGPGPGPHGGHGHGPPQHMMVSPNGPMHSMTGPPMHSPIGGMGPMQGPGVGVGGPGNGGPMGSPMGPMNGDMNNPMMGNSGPPMNNAGPMSNQHGPGMPISAPNGPIGPPPQSMNNNNFMMSPMNNIYSKPMPVSAGKVYPADQPMVFNSQNPNAPPIYPCGVCHKEVHDNDQAILCESGCNFWFHRGCTGLTEGAFQMLTAEVYAEWACDKCLSTKNIPLVKFKP